MKVKELIARLLAVDPDMEVTTASDEFGLIPLTLIEQVSVIKMVPTKQNAAQYRLIRKSDQATPVTVLCCGPSDPGLLRQAL